MAVWDEQIKGTRRVVIGRAIVKGPGPARFTREILAAAGAVYPAVAAVAGRRRRGVDERTAGRIGDTCRREFSERDDETRSEPIRGCSNAW